MRELCIALCDKIGPIEAPGDARDQRSCACRFVHFAQFLCTTEQFKCSRGGCSLMFDAEETYPARGGAPWCVCDGWFLAIGLRGCS